MKQLKRNLKILLGREPNLRVTKKLPTEFHGSKYGGWAILRDSLAKDSTVISVGIGEDASFDLSLIKKYGCKILAFDPTPKSVEWVEKNIKEPLFKLHKIALSHNDGYLRLFLPTNPNYVSASLVSKNKTSSDSFNAEAIRLKSLIGKFNIKTIDLLKMDIEGAEYDVIKDGLTSGALLSVKQLLIEFHHYFPEFCIDHTIESVRRLNESGFEIAWISDSGHEVLFVNEKNPLRFS